MTNTYTPGPWEWINSHTDAPYAFGSGEYGYPSLRTVKHYGEDKTEIRDGKHYTSFCLPKFILDAQEPPQNPADAYLIAAAPDLLEALQYVLDTHVFTGNDGEEANNCARAAIAKATGNSP